MTDSRNEPVTRLWFGDKATPQEIAGKLLQHATTVEFLRCRCDALFGLEEILELKLPKLQDLAIGSLTPFVERKALPWLSSLQSLQRLQVARTELTEDILRALRNAPWLPHLTYLEMEIASIDDFQAWEKLWQSKPLAVRILCLHFVKTEEAIAVIRGNLPSLEYLILGSSINDDFAVALAQAQLPALADVELRFTALSGDAVRGFVAVSRPGLPKLARVGCSYGSDRREEFCDWNGAVVDWGYETMTDSELEGEFFADSKLTLLPSDDAVERKFSYEHARYAFGTFIARPAQR